MNTSPYSMRRILHSFRQEIHLCDQSILVTWQPAINPLAIF